MYDAAGKNVCFERETDIHDIYPYPSDEGRENSPFFI